MTSEQVWKDNELGRFKDQGCAVVFPGDGQQGLPATEPNGSYVACKLPPSSLSPDIPHPSSQSMTSCPLASQTPSAPLVVWAVPREEDRVPPIKGHSPWTAAGSCLHASEWPWDPLESPSVPFFLLSLTCRFFSRVLLRCFLCAKPVSVAAFSGSLKARCPTWS